MKVERGHERGDVDGDALPFSRNWGREGFRTTSSELNYKINEVDGRGGGFAYCTS